MTKIWCHRRHELQEKKSFAKSIWIKDVCANILRLLSKLFIIFVVMKSVEWTI